MRIQGNKHWKWAGDRIGYTGLHHWVRKRFKKPKVCTYCGKRKKLELANKGIYNRNLRNWVWLCKKCHSDYDKKNRPRLYRKRICNKCGNSGNCNSRRVFYCPSHNKYSVFKCKNFKILDCRKKCCNKIFTLVDCASYSKYKNYKRQIGDVSL